ncbi:MAG: FeoB-associated Cys-rich membrane protein [Ruminococcaceae bacterium]|nr:FeoB-associated Cys-rich membrane protein [Oscillospiraceae bacterium]
MFLAWLQQNWGNILVIAMLVTLMAVLVYTMIRSKRKNKRNGCCGGCSGCALQGKCHAKPSNRDHRS